MCCWANILYQFGWRQYQLQSYFSNSSQITDHGKTPFLYRKSSEGCGDQRHAQEDLSCSETKNFDEMLNLSDKSSWQEQKLSKLMKKLKK